MSPLLPSLPPEMLAFQTVQQLLRRPVNHPEPLADYHPRNRYRHMGFSGAGGAAQQKAGGALVKVFGVVSAVLENLFHPGFGTIPVLESGRPG